MIMLHSESSREVYRTGETSLRSSTVCRSLCDNRDCQSFVSAAQRTSAAHRQASFSSNPTTSPSDSSQLVHTPKSFAIPPA